MTETNNTVISDAEKAETASNIWFTAMKAAGSPKKKSKNFMRKQLSPQRDEKLQMFRSQKEQQLQNSSQV